MPLYSELVKIEDEYNYSANIQFDIENDKKMLRFIPNETTIDLMREYFIDIIRPKSLHHARILYGSYGTGKSHFLTVLSLLLSKTYTKGIAYNSFMSRISEYDENLAHDIHAYVNDNSQKPLLIVPIVFDFDDFERCIYFSLKKKLDLIGKKISFKTFFDQAAALIDNWKNNDESKQRLLEACERTNITLESLEEMLNALDRRAENKFQKIFSEMTYGVKYIYEVSNIEENINQANEVIADEYDGIVFIFDEFGRYIEDNIKSIRVKSVQNIAEFCDHGKGNNHIILVSHKEISQYTKRFGKSVANEWKKVEGRYKATPINNSQDQCLSLIKNIIVKNEDVWTAYQSKYKEKLNALFAEAADFKGFLLDSNKGERQLENGFPLHPISLFVLDKLSKRVAQNERTFFTYLASKEDNSLYRFLQRNNLQEFHFVGVDEIYDYFEPSIKSTQSESSYEWFKELQIALSKNNSSTYDDTPETKILKVIATIGIINDTSAIVSNKTTILSVIDCPNDILSNALESLCERKIIKYSGAYDRYNFFEASIFDVESIIDEESQTVSMDSVINKLNEEFVNFVLYPYDYNRSYKISRVFIPTYASLQDLKKKSFANKFGKYYDGILVMLLLDSTEELDYIAEVSADLHRSIIFAKDDCADFIKLVKNYIAVKYLESKKTEYTAKDPAFDKELDYFKEEFYLSILTKIQDWKNKFDDTVTLVYDGKVIDNVDTFMDLSKIASNIMYSSYPNTLIVNNELINKNVISGSILTAKKNVISNIIRGAKPEEYYEVQYLSPDYIAVRSVLVKNGFINVDENITENSLENGVLTQIKVKKEIERLVNKGKTEIVNFEELYTVLKKPPYGLRNGYLSLLFAHILIPYKKSLIINSHGVEKEITVELFEEIVRRPKDYSFTIADWSREQIDYLDSLEKIFSDYINQISLSKNRLKAIYDAMMSHYKNMSKFSRTTQLYVSNETKLYRRILEKSTANYSIFIFKTIKSLGKNFDDVVLTVSKVKMELEYASAKLVQELSESVCQLFGAFNSVSLYNLFIDNYTKSWKMKKSKSFDYYTNAFLDFVSKLDTESNDYSIIVKLSKTLTGFELLYWNDNHKDEFMKRLSDIKDKLDSYQASGQLDEKEAKMTLITSMGEEKSLVFDRNEMSDISKMLKNKIKSTFNNYGLSVSYDEKVQVLLSLLEDFMEGK